MRNIKLKSFGLFPLAIVILPKESIRLHIYQPKFKALINDCFASGKDFVVPFIHNGKQTNYGTCVKLVDVERFYPDGKMDIKVEGSHIVKVNQIHSAKDLSYQTGEIEPVDSSLPQIHAEKLSELFAKYAKHQGIDPNTLTDEFSLFQITRNLSLNKDIKIKLLKSANNAVIQSKIILNELRLIVLTQELESACGYRYYMN